MDGMDGHAHFPAGSVAAPPDLASRLRSRGLRVTPQREQVLATVRALGHATPEQISEQVSGVDVTTVYRTLELLEELGLVRHAHLGHGAPSYRPAEDDHIHVVCHICGRVVDADPTLVDDIADRLRAESGFVLDRSHFTVFGRCRDCAAAEQILGPER
jgi:Fur family ferric uptake transcriptional regulator